MNSNILQLFSILIAFFATLCSGIQPSYQVSIYVRLHPRGPPVHLCTGQIVQSRLVLITASCAHYQFSSSGPVLAIVPSMLSVIGGSTTPFTDALTVQVADILVAKNFNYTTGANDVALLRLTTKLPLDKRNDMKWIILDDGEIYDGPCLANFYVRNSHDGTQNYIQSEQLPILDTEQCDDKFEYSIKRTEDICSLYYLPTNFNCNDFENLHKFNGDRGTGLVCENKLFGILSTILPLQNKIDCIENSVKAYYTSLGPHLEWIYTIITEEDLKMLSQGDYVSSSPYAGETNAFIQPVITESGSTMAYYGGNITNATEPSVQSNSSAHTVISFKFLPVIFSIYFLLLRSPSSN